MTYLSRAGCFAYTICSVHLWCMLEVLWRFERRTFFIGSMTVNLIWACQEVLRQVWPSMNQNRLLFIQIQNTTSKHAQVERYYRFCMQNNQWEIMGDQLLTKRPIELKDDSKSRMQENVCLPTMNAKLNLRHVLCEACSMN
jgi:hypothetical protein